MSGRRPPLQRKGTLLLAMFFALYAYLWSIVVTRDNTNEDRGDCGHKELESGLSRPRDGDGDGDGDHSRSSSRFTKIELPSAFFHEEPSACQNWKRRCRFASETVASASKAKAKAKKKDGVGRFDLEPEYFPSSACETRFSCASRQSSAWNTSSFAYQPHDADANADTTIPDTDSNNNDNNSNANYLVLHLPGTGSKPLDQTDYAETIASAGYYVLSLSHASWPFAVANSDAFCLALASRSDGATAMTTATIETIATATASDCNTRLHESVVFGTPDDSDSPPERDGEFSWLWPVPPDESIRALAIRALRELGWDRFLRNEAHDGSNNNNNSDSNNCNDSNNDSNNHNDSNHHNTSDENPVDAETDLDWSRVIATGHSQGASHAAYLSTRVPLAAAVLLSGPQEIVGASWMKASSAASTSTSTSTATATTRRSLYSKHERCGPDPYEDNFCSARYRAGGGPAGGILARNSRWMGMTPASASASALSSAPATGSEPHHPGSFVVVQDCVPAKDCDGGSNGDAQRTTGNNDSCYHNSNAFDSAPQCVRDLWKVLYEDLV